MWFKEVCNGFGFMVKVKKKLYEAKHVQKIELFDTEFGKMLVLDGKIQTIETFEFYYHEMLVHVPMLIHENPKKVLLIGGGDGYSLREILKHNPDEVLVVEVDKKVIEISKTFLGAKDYFNNEKVSTIYQDGGKFIKNCKEKFDVVIVDGTDPSPVSKSLFSEEFFTKCFKVSDVFCTQSQSPIFQFNYFKDILEKSKKLK
ncbi:spermidine synthase, partial [Candidatus Bathyarchaeota archaeon]